MNHLLIPFLAIVFFTAQVSAFPPADLADGCRSPSNDWTVDVATRALKTDPFRLDSREDKIFRFDFYGRNSKLEADGTRIVVRASAERQGDRVSLRMQETGGGPLGLYRDGRLYRLDRNLSWNWMPVTRFGFFVDSNHLNRFMDESELEPDETERVRCDLGRFVVAALEGTARTVEWNPVARVLTFRKENGSIISGRFRSPYDEVIYGTHWAEVHVDSIHGSDLVVGGFVRGKTSLYSTPKDGPALIAALEAKEAKEVSQSWGRPPVDDPLERALGYRLEVALAPELFRLDASRKLRETFLGYGDIIDALRESHSRRRADLDPQAMRAEVAGTAKHLPACLALLADLMAYETESFPDDPTLARIEAEARMATSNLSRWMDKFVLPILDDLEYDFAFRLELADAAADLGLPFPACVEERLVKMRRDPFCDAVFRSRLCEPCNETHLAATREVVRSELAADGMKRIAAETLLRLDAWSDVPSAVADRWFEQEVARPTGGRRQPTTKANEGRRIRSLMLLSAWRSGRTDLIRRLRAAPADADWREAAVLALLRRVGSAELTGRDEQLSADECRALRREFGLPAEAKEPAGSDGAENPIGPANPNPLRTHGGENAAISFPILCDRREFTGFGISARRRGGKLPCAE